MFTRKQSVFSLLLVLSLLLQLPGATLQAAPNAPTQPDNVACRPNEGKVDQVRVEWKDTNDGNLDYKVYRKDVNAAEWGSPLATVTTGTKNGTWKYIDSKEYRLSLPRHRHRWQQRDHAGCRSNLPRANLSRFRPGWRPQQRRRHLSHVLSPAGMPGI